MSIVFQCPKCGSQDVYEGKKTILGGIGGIWGNRSKDVLRKFCRACDIEALPVLNSGPEGTASPKGTGSILPFSLMGVGLVWVLIYYLTSGLFPIPGIANFNIIVGFGITVIGFVLTTRKPK